MNKMRMEKIVNPKICPEQLRKWAETQYDINIEKGWHKPEYDVFHYLCLIMTEVSEVVDADRKQRHASHEICLLEGVEDDDTFFSMYESSCWSAFGVVMTLYETMTFPHFRQSALHFQPFPVSYL